MKRKTNRRTRAATSALIASVLTLTWPLSSSARQDESWRKRAPVAEGTVALRLPRPNETRLDNGLTLVIVEDRRTPIVTVSVLMKLGDADDPPGSSGLTQAAIELLPKGAAGRAAIDIAEEIETLGGRLYAASDYDYSEVTCSILSDSADRAVEILADVVVRPDFPEREVSLYRGNRLEELKVLRQDPAYLVDEYFRRAVYGAHPYGVTPTERSLSRITRSSVRSFYRSRVSPRESVVVVAGDVDSARIERKLRAAFGEWRGGAATRRRSGIVPRPRATSILLVDRPGSEQADIRIGRASIRRSDPRFFQLLMANAILGDGASSRLFLGIREEKGYAYDVSSRVEGMRLGGSWYAAAQTRPEVAADAVKEMLAEMRRLSVERVGRQDLAAAGSYLNGIFSLSLATQGGLVLWLARIHMLGLSRDYLERYQSAIGSVTPEQVSDVARLGSADRVVIVVVGDASKLRGELSKIARVTLVRGRR